MNIYEKLSKIQNELKAPKKQFNKFGNYNYRNAEDILEASKPICAKHKTTLVVMDQIELQGDRYYIKATAFLYDHESELYVSATAYARESENKKGMDSAQITGSTSSYARKYALNGLFNIDDTKDSDFTNKHDKEEIEDKAPTELARRTEMQKATILDLINEGKIDFDKVKEYYKVKGIDELSYAQAQQVINKGKKNKEERY